MPVPTSNAFLVVAIGITAIGVFVGAGGLGDIIIRGTNATDTDGSNSDRYD